MGATMTFYEVITHILIPIPDAIARRWVLASVGGGIPLLRRMVLEEERKGEARITVLVREEDEQLKDILYGTVADMKILEATGQVGDMVRKFRDQGVEVREIPVCDETGRIQLENRLLTGLVKDTEGVMAKLVNRRVSLAVARRLMNRKVTPNQMTLVSMAIGLLGAMFFLLPGQSTQVAGASLFLLHSILDGCDGELARLKFLESRTGGMLDYWTDNIVHVAVFACIGTGGDAWGGLAGMTVFPSGRERNTHVSMVGV